MAKKSQQARMRATDDDDIVDAEFEDLDDDKRA